MINVRDEARLDRGDFQGVLPWTPTWRPPRAIATARSLSGVGPNTPILLTALDFSSGNDPRIAVFPGWIKTTDRKVESRPIRAVDAALPGWQPDSSA
jgi:hypothetical protein